MFQVVGVAQIINKKTESHYFTQNDEEVTPKKACFLQYL